MMTRGGEGGKKCPKSADDGTCERPVIAIVRSKSRSFVINLIVDADE